MALTFPSTARVGVATRRLEVPHLHSRFLNGLTERQRDIVLSFATKRQLPARSIITNQDDHAHTLFLLTNGRARHYYTTVDGKKQILQWLKGGDIAGAAALLEHRSSYLVSTELLEDSTLAVWSREVIRPLVAEYPVLLDNALSIASDYLVWYVATHSALCSGSADQRLRHVLMSLTAGIGLEVSGGRELHLTNEELASAANLTPFTVSRLLSRWQRTGAISKRRGAIAIHLQHFPVEND